MSETMKVAMTFTAIDAASGYIANLEKRIKSLGDAGEKMQAQFEAMKGHFMEGMKGLGMAYTSIQLMKPGIAAAAALEASGISVQNSLADSGKSVKEMTSQFKDMRATALYLSAHSPFAAPDIMRAEKLLINSGFKPGEIAGNNGLAAQVAGMSQLSGQGLEEVRGMTEIISQQFGGGAGGVSKAFDWIAQSGMEDKLPELATGLASMGTRAAAMKIPVNDAITTIEMLENVSRRSGAAIGAFLISTRPDATSSQAVRMRDTGLEFYNKKGNFIGMEATQKLLKQKFGGIENRSKMLEDIFGSGAIAAEGLIKADNLADFNAQNERSLKLQEKVKNLNEGLARSYEQLTESGKNAMGSIFAPMTGFLATAARGGRNVLSGMTEQSEKYPMLSRGIALGLGGAVAGAGLYAAINFGKSFGLLRSIVGGLGSTSTGIIAGKAVEQATGVTPVFITNWPRNMGGGILSTAAGAGGAVAAAKIAKNAAASVMGMGLGSFMLEGAALAVAGLIGWEIGKKIDEGLQWYADLLNFHPVNYWGDKWSDWNEKRYPDAIKRQTEEAQVNENKNAFAQNKIIINMTLDGNGRVSATGPLNSDFEINNSPIMRGNFHGD